jgi:hypothetical protein
MVLQVVVDRPGNGRLMVLAGWVDPAGTAHAAAWRSPAQRRGGLRLPHAVVEAHLEDRLHDPQRREEQPNFVTLQLWYCHSFFC